MRAEAVHVRPSAQMPLVMVALVAVMGGCSTAGGSSDSPAPGTRSTPSREATTGSVTGQVTYVGGPTPGSARPVAGGTVTFSGSARTTATMSEQGRFTVELKPGTYVVTATSPDYNSGGAACEAVHPVRVSAGRTATVEVLCQVK